MSVSFCPLTLLLVKRLCNCVLLINLIFISPLDYLAFWSYIWLAGGVSNDTGFWKISKVVHKSCIIGGAWLIAFHMVFCHWWDHIFNHFSSAHRAVCPLCFCQGNIPSIWVYCVGQLCSVSLCLAWLPSLIYGMELCGEASFLGCQSTKFRKGWSVCYWKESRQLPCIKVILQLMHFCWIYEHAL